MYPDKIGRYEIKAELGRRGMATVYHAYDPMFEREVALKVLPREMLHDEQFRGRFEREAKIIARLEHATMVPVYAVGQENDQPYFVMRYMAGGSLSEKMEAAPISLAEIARIILRGAAALDYAHAKGIIHRDLKPGNILLDEFPATHFIPENYMDNLVLPSFSWDGADLFLFNTFKRNDGYGPLYSYDLAIGQEKKINPILSLCCYRDARFSPDGNYIIFAFQDVNKGANGDISVYYVPFKDVGSDKTLEPLKFPLKFFASAREKPQFALRSAVP